MCVNRARTFDPIEHSEVASFASQITEAFPRFVSYLTHPPRQTTTLGLDRLKLCRVVMYLVRTNVLVVRERLARSMIPTILVVSRRYLSTLEVTDMLRLS